jgi:hypothetical protein
MRNGENMITGIKTRWLAGITAGVAAVSGSLGFGLSFLAVPSILIIGAFMAGRWQRSGTWLLWIGAFFLSLWALPYGGLILVSPPPRSDHSGLGVIAMTATTMLLVVLCDLALLLEAVRRRHARQISP